MPQEFRESSLRDLFAAQGIVAVLAAVLLLALHLFSPETCRAVLASLHETAQNSPSVSDWMQNLAAAATEWFASGSAG
ncbi:MAG: hypothetical protein IKI58_09270 [Oscillospiraceae bacterium]|nr:hypothetical protein [Oscillospiraceae bacterium]